jgi:hypothetical protein
VEALHGVLRGRLIRLGHPDPTATAESGAGAFGDVLTPLPGDQASVQPSARIGSALASASSSANAACTRSRGSAIRTPT